VTDPNATISLDIVVPVTPTGDAGDEVVLNATDSLGNSCTGTSARFPVLAGTNPSVTMTLTCGSATASGPTGNIGVTANVVEGDHCPNILSAVIGPDETSVGSSASVAATASDADSGETLTFAWAPTTATSNIVNTATSSSLTYTCPAAGTQTLTLTVTDSHTPTPCFTTASLTIKCDPVATGAAGATGTGGGVAGTTGTGGVAGTTGTGGGVAGATGTGGVAGTTGTGGVAGTTGAGGAGGMSVPQGDSVACRTCELAGFNAMNCFNTSPPGAGSSVSNFGCEGFTGANLTACQNLLFCLQGQACLAAIQAADVSFSEANLGFDSPLPCLCGTAFNGASPSAQAACVTATSGFNGVCATQFLAADLGGSVTGNFTNPNAPEAVAVNLFSCDIDNPCTDATTCAVGTLP
jgi:hypothetical protein